MSLPITYNYLAVNCPAVRLPTGLIDPYNGAPETQVVVHEYIIQGETTVGLQKHNRNTIRQEAQSRYGGNGSWGIAYGLGVREKAATGLVGVLEIGQASLDGPVVVSAEIDLPLVDNARNFIWLAQTNDPIITQSTTVPSQVATYCGSLLTSGGNIIERDYSGRQEIHQGIFTRRTADVGPPGDTPPTGGLFFAYTNGGFYIFYNGAYYSVIDAKTVKADAGDTGAGSLDEKTKAGTGIALSIVTDAGVKKLLITNTAPFTSPNMVTLDQIYLDIAANTDKIIVINFANKGSFTNLNFVHQIRQSLIDQLPPGLVVQPLGVKGPSMCAFRVLAASNIASYYDYYSTYDKVRLTPELWGFGWVAGAGGADVVEIYDFVYTGDGAGGGGGLNPFEHAAVSNYTLSGGPWTLDGTDELILMVPSGGAVTYCPPPSWTSKREILFVNLSPTYACYVQSAVGETINGVTTPITLAAKYNYVRLLKWVGNAWTIVGQG
jgi:hypothetical protein